jgi:hypothetical protein
VAVKQILEINRTVLDEKYLGLPTPRGRMKGERFQPLKERLSKRLQDYSEKYKSATAKEVLIKAVAQSLLLTDKRRIHLRSASIRTYTFFTTRFPRFLSIRGARGLKAFDLPLLTNLSKPYLWLN